MSQETIGSFLKRQRELRQMSPAEVARVTRIPARRSSPSRCDRFDELPGRGLRARVFEVLRAGESARSGRVLARYTSSRRVAFVTPLADAHPCRRRDAGQSRRFGVAIAFVLLLILFTLALSIVLKPRGHDIPTELSRARPRAPC